MSIVLRILGAAAALAITFVIFTWPLLRHPATTVLDAVSLYGPAAALVQRDINLTMWVLAWDSHALVTDPLHLFNANAFWPAPYTLALSEHMLGNLPLFGPVYLLTGNPVLAHQTTLVASFVLSGLAMAWWIWFWTRDTTAALAAGFLYAFAPFRFWQLGNLHVVSTQYLPLVPLGIDLVLTTRRRVAGACLLVAALVLSTGCSYYVGYAAFALAGVYLPCAMLARGRASLARLPLLLVALAVSGGFLAALSVPYVLLQHAGVITDHTKNFLSLAFMNALFSGPTGIFMRYVWPKHDGIPLFLGAVPMVLALVGIARWRRAPRGALLAVALTGFVLSLGPYLALSDGQIALPYRWLGAIVPGFSAMRVPQRFASLVTLATVALAGFGLASVRASLLAARRPRVALAIPWLAVAISIVALRPGYTQPLAMSVGASVPPAYRWLAEHGDGGPLLEVPSAAHHLQRESVAMYYSTAHWLPLANGYTPYPPTSYTNLMDAVMRLPDPAAMADIRAQQPGLRWLLVHTYRIPDDERAAWTSMLDGAGLRRIGEFDRMALYEFPTAQ
ncbi:MAG TPA: hypothetical protein VGR62_08350 [Candidatus Binatia bacterium]|jgi:hypothetical protein|nr:hypothetical protein [Candidatus Binatia bacterium]